MPTSAASLISFLMSGLYPGPGWTCRRLVADVRLGGVEVLPDIVAPEPVIVFCGLAGAESTKLRDHYYETPGNSFWESLHLSGLAPRRLRPDEDHLVAGLGYGLTDLVGHWDPRWVEIDELVAKLEAWQPEWLAFTSKGVAHEAARA